MKQIMMRYSVAIPLLCVFIFTFADGMQQGWSGWQGFLIENALFYGLGFQMLGFAVGHIFFSDTVAEHIGWEKGSPFQMEVGLAALAIAVLGLLTPRYGHEFHLATVIVATVYLWGCAAGHVRDMLRRKNFAAGNAGYVFWWDIFYPAFLIVLFAFRKGGLLPLVTLIVYAPESISAASVFEGVGQWPVLPVLWPQAS